MKKLFLLLTLMLCFFSLNAFAEKAPVTIYFELKKEATQLSQHLSERSSAVAADRKLTAQEKEVYATLFQSYRHLIKALNMFPKPNEITALEFNGALQNITTQVKTIEHNENRVQQPMRQQLETVSTDAFLAMRKDLEFLNTRLQSLHENLQQALPQDLFHTPATEQTLLRAKVEASEALKKAQENLESTEKRPISFLELRSLLNSSRQKPDFIFFSQPVPKVSAEGRPQRLATMSMSGVKELLPSSIFIQMPLRKNTTTQEVGVDLAHFRIGVNGVFQNATGAIQSSADFIMFSDWISQDPAFDLLKEKLATLDHSFEIQSTRLSHSTQMNFSYQFNDITQKGILTITKTAVFEIPSKEPQSRLERIFGRTIKDQRTETTVVQLEIGTRWSSFGRFNMLSTITTENKKTGQHQSEILTSIQADRSEFKLKMPTKNFSTEIFSATEYDHLIPLQDIKAFAGPQSPEIEITSPQRPALANVLSFKRMQCRKLFE